MTPGEDRKRSDEIADAMWLRHVGLTGFRETAKAAYRAGREDAAKAVEGADTSGWPGGRGSDVDGCQERAAAIARGQQPREEPWQRRAAATGGGPCPTCQKPFWTHVCLSCSPDFQTPGPGCHNCRNTGMDQTPCQPARGGHTTERGSE